jgi:tetratricopeptide (TPR) repeat protein
MATSLNFLVVDQSKESHKLWTDTLKTVNEECRVDCVFDAEQALEVAEEKKLALIIASWELQPVSCVVLMQKLRDLSKAMHVPVLIFAGRLGERDLALAKEFDIPDILLAPFEETKVRKKVEEMLRQENDMDSISRNLRKVETWLREGRVSEALSMITSCLKKGPEAAKSYYLYGEIWLLTNKFEQAEKAFKESLRYDPNFTRSTNGLGKCYLKTNKFDEAMAVFEGLHRKVPGNISRLVTMGNAYLDHGDEDKAKALFIQAQSLDKSNADAALGVGKIEFSNGNIGVASELFRASGKGEELASYYNGMAIALVSKGKYDEAIKLYLDALSAIPSNSKESLLHFNIALAYRKSGRCGDAADSFARAVVSSPSYVKALSGLICCAKEAEKGGLSYDKNLACNALKVHKLHRSQEQKAS